MCSTHLCNLTLSGEHNLCERIRETIIVGSNDATCLVNVGAELEITTVWRNHTQHIWE